MYSLGEPITLHASATRTGTTKSATDTAAYATEVRIADVQGPVQALVFELDVSAAAKEVGDKLDVTIQTQVVRASTARWVDIVAFTQCLGNGSTKRYFAKIAAGAALTMFENATALTAGSVRDFWGEWLRVKYVTTNDADDPVDTSFTFEVTVTPI